MVRYCPRERKVLKRCAKLLKLPTAILLLIGVVTIQSCHTSNRYGMYRGSEYMSGYSIILKPDSTFEYRRRGSMVSDTSAGNYYLKGDTMYFTYTYDPYKSQTLPPPVPVRPRFALWKQNKLYPFYSFKELLNRRQVLKYTK